MNYQGYLIYRTRIQRNWSQAGLCKGICAVSYLSKIETGKAEPSEEILQLLMDRLDLKCDKRTEQEAAELNERQFLLAVRGLHAVALENAAADILIECDALLHIRCINGDMAQALVMFLHG